jgi:Protein of unknown function (DUF2470)
VHKDAASDERVVDDADETHRPLGTEGIGERRSRTRASTERPIPADAGDLDHRGHPRRQAAYQQLAAHAAAIPAHMNQDHGAALIAYCQAFSRAIDTSAATMTGVDRYGFELSAQTAVGQRPIRLGFARSAPSKTFARRSSISRSAHGCH